ncbi:hypothetical protein QTP86_034246, partial [Hemibagrus guttatus]
MVVLALLGGAPVGKVSEMPAQSTEEEGGDRGKVEDFEGGRKKRRRGGGRKQLFPHHLVFSQKK